MKIGFVTSLLLHSLLAVAFLTKEDSIKISKQKSNTISISLENIQNKMANQSINQQKKHQKPKKKKQKKPPKEKPKKEIIKPKEIPKEVVVEEVIEPQEVVEEVVEEIAEDTTEISHEAPNDAQDTQDSATSGGAQELDMNSQLYAEILAIINKHNEYPRDAYRRGITGSVEVRFVLRTNGEIEDIEVLNNIHRSLSQGAINAIKNAYKKFPSINNNLRIKVKLTYNLT